MLMGNGVKKMGGRRLRCLVMAAGVLLLPLLPRHAFCAGPLPLGTLFFSPEERAAIVAGRSSGESSSAAIPPHTTSQPVPRAQEASSSGTTAASVRYTLSGVVKRGGGKSVIWLNGQPVEEATLGKGKPTVSLSGEQVVIEGRRVRVGESVEIVVPGDAPRP